MNVKEYNKWQEMSSYYYQLFIIANVEYKRRRYGICYYGTELLTNILNV